METAQSIKDTTKLIYRILIQDEDARNSDDALYAEVLRIYGNVYHIDFDRVGTLRFFTVARKYFNVPSLETVGRCRRKLQELHPELTGERAADGRHEQMELWMDFARER